MTIKLLNLSFKFGGLMALTPICVNENVLFPSKAYSLLWIILFTTGVAISGMYRKESYQNLSPMRLVLQTSLDLLLLSLNICTIITTAKKRQQWMQLINNLKTVESSNNKDSFWFLPFVMANVVFLVFHSYETFIWTRIMGVAFYKLYAVEWFQFYAQFIVYFFIYVILNMFLKKYQSVSKIVSKQNFALLRNIQNDICILADCVDVFNNLFGFLILLLVAFTTLQILIYVQGIVIGAKNTIETVAYSVMFILWHIVWTFSGILTCDSIMREFGNMQMMVYKIETSCIKGKENELGEIKKILNVINADSPNFTAARFFGLNRRTILGVSNTVVTFLIIMVQKASYEKLTPVILTIQVATDTVLFVLNISTIIITATKRHQWNRFINILKFLKNRNEKGDLFWFLPFLLTNVVFVVIFTYYTYIWTPIMGVDFFKLYAVEYFQFYAQFIVGTFNGVFICDLTEQRVKTMRMVAYQTAANFDGEREVEEIKKLINVINDNFPHFTAARYFDLNRKTILGVLNAFFTFLIVVIQFDNVYN
ncbi:uncharacterized protein LOC123011458 [Tribolium madens]|uniref:uncharacterized protein LOC123011458 n=1 Tax=Tribolium madens TaxID=41895 RepID=UPI001CF7489D|nr:uncharacterized protein LOC123011458 [Tribolium madens]